MNELFQNVLEASFHGGILIAVVLLARLALKKAPKKYICLLWLLAALRLLMPLEIESAFSLQPDLTPSIRSGSKNVQQEDIPEDTMAAYPTSPAVPDAQEYPEDVAIATTPNAVVEEEPKAAVDYTRILSWIWLTVAAGMLAYSAGSYLRLRRRVGDAVILSEGVWVSGRVSSPFVMGFLRPRIYLNPGLGEGDRAYVLAHERCHIRRGDHLWKLLGYITLAVHWFNPLVWLGYILLCRDLEMACDEAVVKEMEVTERKAYSAALLACSAKGHTIAACPVAFGEVSVKERIGNVLNYRKPKFWIILIAILAVVIVAVCFLTSPVQNNLLTFSGLSADQITRADLQYVATVRSMSGERELEALVDVLKSVRFARDTEAGLTIPSGEAVQHCIVLHHGEESVTLYFENDYSIVYNEDCNEIRQIENPQILQDYMATATERMAERATSGEPFAAMGEPWKWTANVTLDAIETAKYGLSEVDMDGTDAYEKNESTGTLPVERFAEIIAVLNDIPADAFTEQDTVNGRSPVTYSADALRSWFYTTKVGASVTMVDRVNGLYVAVRYYCNLINEEETLELVMSDDMEGLDATRYLTSVRCWAVEDDALLAIMKEVIEHIPYTMKWSSSYDWGVTLMAENVTPTGMTLVVERSGGNYDGDIEIQRYGIYREMGDSWELVGFCGLEEPVYYLAQDETVELTLDWETAFGPLEPGTYVAQIGLTTDYGQYVRFSVAGDVPEVAQQSVWGVTAHASNASATGIKFWFVQTDDSISGELVYGQAYTLERWDGTQWAAVSPVIDNGVFTAEAILLPKNATTVVDIDWEWLHGTLPDGYYRIGKDVWLDSERHTFHVGFGVGEGYGDLAAAQTEDALREATVAAVSDRTYTYEKTGFGGEFTIQILGDGTFFYYEGMLSSYIGFGSWSVEGDILTLTDTGLGSHTRYYRFSVNNSYLYFLAEGSDRFTYVEVADGDRFVGSGRAAAGEGLARDQTFYEELFTRQVDGAYATMWVGDLYEAFYAEPEEFARQLSRKYSEDPGQVREVLTLMSYELEWYEPERFLEILKELRQAEDLDQTVVDLLEKYYWEGEYRALGGSNAVTVADSGQDYLAAALGGCEIIEGRHTQVSPESPYYYSFIACSVDADEEITALYQEQGYFDENTYAFSLGVIFVPGDHEWALVYCMAGNTGEYSGSDPEVPEGALEYYRCGYVTWTENGWRVEIVGTGW